jgi:hypothetical protein
MKKPLGAAALMIQRTAALRRLAVGHRLKQCGHRWAEHFRQMRAGLQPTDLLPDQFAPSLADALADQALQDRLDLDAVGNGVDRMMVSASRMLMLSSTARRRAMS